jgi:hypothetical protein
VSVVLAAGARPGRRVVTVMNAAIAVAVVVLVAAVALVVRPPAPPGIAEFAPQASKPITQAPPGQSSVFGHGAAACMTGGSCAGAGRVGRQGDAKAAGQPGGVPSALQCFTWPDGSVTQTFDPQSPPCIATWPGAARGNGGATAAGVTGTEIRLAVLSPSASDLSAQLRPMVDFVNTHFELYGRHIVLVNVNSKQADEANSNIYEDPQAQQADAKAVVAKKVFASTDFVAPGPYMSALPTFVHTLAQSHVLSLSGGDVAAELPAADYHGSAPYELTYQPSTQTLMSTAAKVVCRQLANRAAAHSTTYASVPRKFAVVLPDPSINGGQVAGLSDLTAQLNQCGLRDIPIVYYNDQDSGNASLSASYINLKNSGVTTLIFYPFWGGAREYGPQAVADSAAYYPEWFTIGWGRWVSANLAAGPQSETVNTFGVGDWNKSGPLASQPWYQAFTDGGGTADQGTVLNPGDGFYHELLMLASGAQMAGPHLTAATLSAALESTVFPNPGAAGPPYYQGRVGFGDGSNAGGRRARRPRSG